MKLANVARLFSFGERNFLLIGLHEPDETRDRSRQSRYGFQNDAG